MSELKRWRCKNGHVLGLVKELGHNRRQLRLFRHAIDLGTAQPADDDTFEVLEGAFVLDVRCDVPGCGLLRHWVALLVTDSSTDSIADSRIGTDKSQTGYGGAMLSRKELVACAVGPMPPFVRELRDAIRAGQKTETRRILKKQPPKGWGMGTLANGFAFYKRRGDGAWEDLGKFMCPYGKAGQVRYLREPIYKGPGGFAHYADDDVMVWDAQTCQRVPWRWKPKKLSQLYMPAAFARTFVQLDAVSGEMLWQIDDEGAQAEGVATREAFVTLWDGINAKRGYPFAGDWWVWVLGFSLYGLVTASSTDSITDSRIGTDKGKGRA